MLWIFSSQPATTRRTVKTRLEVECLQDRVLPSASALLDIAHVTSSHSAAEHTTGKAHQHFSFPLKGTTAARGRAEVEVVRSGAQANLTKLAVHIQRAPAKQTLSVFVDDGSTAVGTIKTNAGGAGKLALKGLSVPVHTGSVLKVEDAAGNVVMQGTFRLPGHRHA